ncbi:MAG TPA: YjbQ family protein [Campylobacteraceae bacterium]|nr:YjbQ family protein [Campylobacteraceae bacterium]HHD84191.1 YjbQ family protein [Campylobacteraceae bacterium]
MKILQKTFRLPPFSRGFHLIHDIVEREFAALNRMHTATLHLFLKHTSASLALGENADPSVRVDLENYFSDIVDDKPYFTHTLEGRDDMPAHIKSTIIGVSLTLPVTDGRLNLGIWQGVYLCEHREHAGSREIVMTIMGE